MDKEKGTIAVSLVEEAIRCVERCGVDPSPMLELAGISSQLLASPQARVSSTQYGALWNAIGRGLDDEFFGQDSHPMRSGSFIAMCQAALTARDGAQAIARATGFMRLVLDDIVAHVDISSECVRLVYRLREGVDEKPMFAYATHFILVYGLVCWLVGRRIPVRAARFGCAEPAAGHEYRSMFCDDLRFEQGQSYVELEPTFLALPVVQTPKSLKTFLRNAPASFIVKYRNPDSLAARVRRALRARPIPDWPAADVLAEELRIAEATMRRKLKREGETYQSIKDALRRDIAIAALQSGEGTIADIAVAVGFAEPSAFHRAFRKWTGARPTDYRPASAGAT
ncbi:AraC family transcriptional regulator [Trinickia dabaoshanensis]|uniref:AraC family transcriptional regulator n=1 Tax=Trinickia dabaoshanensis TaxID=564714 RepID=A0A2N7VXZ3_9BURK|nr:AraC family transcriptional regulator [Trinickia dabaoshanensis]PMS22016.1 AraC family transcriptional regulator [Trinickia dabaoshanensis]